MLVLPNDTWSLQIVLSGSTVAPLPVLLSSRIFDSAAYTADAVSTETAGTTPVTILTGSSTQDKVVDFVSVFNPNVANATVTIRTNVSGTVRVLTTVILGQNERLEYDGGWKVLASTGAIKTSLNQGANAAESGESKVVLASDVTNNNATANTLQDVTGLSFPVVAGQRYFFEFQVRYTAAATTTGSRWTISGPGITELTYSSRYSLTSTSQTVNEGLTAFDLPAASSASSATTTGNLANLLGVFVPSADGTVILRFASEISASAIVAKAGSHVRYYTL